MIYLDWIALLAWWWVYPFIIEIDLALIDFNLSVLDSFGRGITSLLSSFGHVTPCLLSKIIKIIFISCWKAYHLYEIWGWLWTYYHFARWYFIRSNFSKVDKNDIQFHLGYMLDCICIQYCPKIVRFWSKSSFKLQKCPVNKLKVVAFTASFSPHDVIESCVEIFASMLNSPTKFKLIKLSRR